MKAGPVDSAVVPFEDIFDHRICSSEEIRVHPGNYCIGGSVEARGATNILLPEILQAADASVVREEASRRPVTSPG